MRERSPSSSSESAAVRAPRSRSSRLARRRRLVHRARAGDRRRPTICCAGSCTLALLGARGRALPAPAGRGARSARGGARRARARGSGRSRSRTRAPSAPAARTGPASCSARSASCCSRSASDCSGARASRVGSAGCAGRAIAVRHRRRRLLARRAGRDGDPRHAPPARGGRAGDLGRPYEQVTLRTSDGLELAGWYVRSRNGAAVISTRPARESCRRRGCSPATATACCSSTRAATTAARATRTCSAGTTRKDIDAAVAWLQQQPDVKDGRIGGIGFSVGGEMMLQAAAVQRGLRAVVSDGAGLRSVREDLLRGPRGWFAAPEGRPCKARRSPS